MIQSIFSWSQQTTDTKENDKSFWKKVHIGGGIQLGISNNYTTIGISPSGIYELSEKISAGIGVSYLYSKYKYDGTQFHVFGSSVVALYNPFKGLQLSTEFEELSVNSNINNSYWVPAWYMGAAYSMGRFMAIGIRYDVLYDEGKSIYDTPLTPFVRIYF
jgi:long-subunit fatty acid transport protein